MSEASEIAEKGQKVVCDALREARSDNTMVTILNGVEPRLDAIQLLSEVTDRRPDVLKWEFKTEAQGAELSGDSDQGLTIAVSAWLETNFGIFDDLRLSSDITWCLKTAAGKLPAAPTAADDVQLGVQQRTRGQYRITTEIWRQPSDDDFASQTIVSIYLDGRPLGAIGAWLNATAKEHDGSKIVLENVTLVFSATHENGFDYVFDLMIESLPPGGCQTGRFELGEGVTHAVMPDDECLTEEFISTIVSTLNRRKSMHTSGEPTAIQHIYTHVMDLSRDG